MKKSLIIVTAILLLTLTVTSCNKPNTPNTPTPTPSAEVSASPVIPPSPPEDWRGNGLKYYNAAMGVTLELPPEWEGHFTIEFSDSVIAVYTSPLPTEGSATGIVGWFAKVTREEFETDVGYTTTPNKIVAEVGDAEDNLIIWGTPSDVQFDNETSENYQMLRDGIYAGLFELYFD
ncbi:MAG: hypothetical protein LBN02_06865 [Oscillospiraceae bacterium]|jgi:hypothetical protein|nr:hypothetical protein [Oscillospiraceae bacterium]